MQYITRAQRLMSQEDLSVRLRSGSGSPDVEDFIMRVHALCLFVLTRFLPMVKTDFPEIHNTSTAEDRLMRYLLDEERYNRFVRPVKHHDDKLIIAIRLAPTVIDLVDQEFIVHSFLPMEWQDDFLKWNEKANDGIVDMYIPVNRVWFPQISLMNSLNERDQDYFWDAKISVIYYGLVRWTPWTKFKAPCPMDLWRFPLDEQTCKLEFRRSDQDTHLVDLEPWVTEPHIEAGPILLDYYTKNNAWEITGHSAVRKEAMSENHIPRPAVTFTFNLRRRDSYLRLMFVGPAVVLALLTPVLFLLPAHDTGKFTLGGTLMVCTSIFLVVMKQYLPTSTDSLPVLCVYYIVTFILLALSLVLSALTNNIANRNMRLGKLADALRKVSSSCLGRFLLLPNMEYGIGSSHMEPQDPNNHDAGLNISKPRPAEDWLLVAAVLDRIFCFLFTIVVIITSLALLL